MKIDGNRPAADADSTRQVGAAGSPPRAATEKLAGRPTDRLEVSRDARLVSNALKALEEAPAIRPDVVEQMRELLHSRELGADSARLADALIDHLLGK